MKFLYILRNNALEHVLKCGFSSNPYRRCQQLSAAMPEPFDLVYNVAIPDDITDKDFFKVLEEYFPDCIHTSETNGVIKRTEYIDLRKISQDELIKLMKKFALSFNSGLNAASKPKRVSTERRRNFSFFRLGIKIGDKLVFRNKNCKMDGTEVYILNDNQVMYNKLHYSTSALAQKFLSVPYPVNGNKYFYYKDKSISDLREEIEFVNES